MRSACVPFSRRIFSPLGLPISNTVMQVKYSVVREWESPEVGMQERRVVELPELM